MVWKFFMKMHLLKFLLQNSETAYKSAVAVIAGVFQGLLFQWTPFGLFYPMRKLWQEPPNRIREKTVEQDLVVVLMHEVDVGSRDPPHREIILSVVCEGSPDPQQLTDAMKRYEEMEEERQGRKKYQRKRGKIKNIIIRRMAGKYLMETTHMFNSLTDLIHYYKDKPGFLMNTEFQLCHPIRLQSWEYCHADVQQGGTLGEGAFGIVSVGTLRTKSGKCVSVAVKQTKSRSNLCKAKIKEMMKEARLMRNFKHKNIVRTYGVAVDEQPLLLILELVTGGALNHFLHDFGDKMEVMEKLVMCLGAGSGVEYLHQNHCMHRDLAARNCLITDEKVVKISDFGLSRMGSHYVLKSAVKLPIKWLAPETISTFTFSLKSDVYTFGVLVFEIFANGAEPWDGFSNSDVKAAILSGKCLTLPSCCPEKLRDFLICRVFTTTPTRRTSMTEVVKMLRSLCPNAALSSRSEQRCATKRRHVLKHFGIG